MNMKTAYSVAISATISVVLFTSQTYAVVPVGDVNTINDGRIITGKTYYNTPGAVSTFINSGSGGIWLKSGTTLRGQEVDSTGNFTSNGGALHIYAPASVVRLDGNIDVNSVRDNQGAYTGAGGKVFIDSAYLFQNGNIYANGDNGGHIQINVGGMTLGQGAQIQTNGKFAGGEIAISSNGPVDLRRNSSLQTAGSGFEGSDVISVEGSLVNVDGQIKANTLLSALSQGSTIRLVATGQSNLQNLKDTLQTATQISPGDASGPTISAQEGMFLLQRANSQIQNHDGDIVVGRDTSRSVPAYIGQLNANGLIPSPPDFYSFSNHGGSIILSAMHDVVNQGQILANGSPGNMNGDTNGSAAGLAGGSGGTISLTALNNIRNDGGRLEANGGNGAQKQGYIDPDGTPQTGDEIFGTLGGRGGNGGLIAFGYHTGMSNTGNIYANGGQGGSGSEPVLNGAGATGGLVVFSGDTNPVGHGSIDVIGRPGGNNSYSMGGMPGTIVSPSPSTLGQGQVYFQQGYENGQFVSRRATEKAQIDEVLVDGGNGDMIALTKNGGSTPTNLLSRLLNATYRTVDEPTGFHSTMLEDGYNMSFANLVVHSSQNNLATDMNIPSSFKPGDLSIFEYLGSLNLTNNGKVILPTVPGPYENTLPAKNNFWMGQHFENGIARLSFLATGDVNNSTGSYWGGSVNIATKGSYFGGGILATSSNPDYGGTLQAGNIMIKAGKDITQYTKDGSFLKADGELFGGVIQLYALHDINFNGNELTTATISANGSYQGGIVNLQAGHNILMNATGVPDQSSQAITANGTAPINGRGGYVSLKAGNSRQINGVAIEANGGLRNGTVSLKP